MPRPLAVSSLNRLGAATVTDAAPPLAISCASNRPVGPAPNTRALDPGRICSVSTPCMAHAAGSANTAVSAARPSTENTSVSATVTYSAKNPGKLLPYPLAFSQRISRPARQYWQWPQYTLGLTVTCSPSAKRLTPSPS